MRHIAARWFLLVALSGTIGPALAGETKDPHLMLDRMSTAMSQMSYQGTFVYVQGDEVETMRITHVSDRHGVRERLITISGAQREILRDSTGIRWVLADDSSVFEDQGYNRSFFPELPADQYGLTDVSYSLHVGHEARIAGHKAQNLKVIPRDKYRYGYSLWLEKHSGLLLKWELIGSDSKTIAKMMFTDIKLGSEVDQKELTPSTQLKKYKTVESKLPSGRGFSKSTPRWKPDSLPPGFKLTSHRYFGEKDQGTYEHLVYSDGLAAVSVYVEDIRPDSDFRTGLSRLGTTHAFSRATDDMLITVVGDVPEITVKSIGNSVEIIGH